MNLNELKIKVEKYFLNNKNGENNKIILEILNKYDGDDWKNYVNFNDEKYSRNIIFQSKLFEILLLCWKPNQKSFIHNHPKNGCFLKIIEGELKEKLYLKNKSENLNNNFNENTEILLKKNDISFIHDDIGYHSVSNESLQNCISLHIDSPGYYLPKKIEIKNNLIIK